jgi:hypothetical protein
MINRRRSEQHGAVLVQLAITLPIFLSLVLFCLWISQVINAKVSLEFAVRNAVRLSVPRGISTQENFVMAIPDVVNYVPWGVTTQHIEDLLNTVPTQVMSQAEQFYRDYSVEPVFGPRELYTLPYEYTYAIIYASQSMRLSLGSAVQYPCPAKGVGARPGCLQCTFLHPLCEDLTPITDTSSSCRDPAPDGSVRYKPPVEWDSDLNSRTPTLRGKIALRCEFRLPDSIFTPMTSLLALVTPSIGNSLSVVTSQAASDPVSIVSDWYVPTF